VERDAFGNLNSVKPGLRLTCCDRAYSSPWSPTATDAVLEPDDETETQPSLYDETREERDERFRNLRAVQDSRTPTPDYLPAPLFYSSEPVLPELDEVQLNQRRLLMRMSLMRLLEKPLD
jgi:hypothetical protein